MRKRKLINLGLAVSILIFSAINTYAQTTAPAPSKPRRQHLTFYFDAVNSRPLHLQEYPLEQLANQELGWDWEKGEYRSRDDLIRINVTDFSRKNRGGGFMLYPFGARNGVTLALKGGYETMPTIKFSIKSPKGTENYALTNAKAYNVGIGAYVNDPGYGWGMGSHSFVLVGVGKIKEPRGDGKRQFVEFGGGIDFGPLGFDIVVNINRNHLYNPRPHDFFTVPIGIRGTISF